MIPVLAFATFMEFSSWRRTLAATLGGIAFYLIAGLALPAMFGTAAARISLASGTSGLEHFETIMDGLKMFLSFPVFGAGLGAFLAAAETSPPAVIHSTPVWLLAETGIAGFAVFVTTFVCAAVYLFKHRRRLSGFIGLQVLLLLAVFGEVHEILYQRPIWLLLGFALYTRDHGPRSSTGPASP